MTFEEAMKEYPFKVVDQQEAEWFYYQGALHATEIDLKRKGIL